MGNEARSQAVTTAFRKMDEGGLGVIGAAELGDRYEKAAAAAGTGAGTDLAEARKALLDNFSHYQVDS